MPSPTVDLDSDTVDSGFDPSEAPRDDTTTYSPCVLRPSPVSGTICPPYFLQTPPTTWSPFKLHERHFFLLRVAASTPAEDMLIVDTGPYDPGPLKPPSPTMEATPRRYISVQIFPVSGFLCTRRRDLVPKFEVDEMLVEIKIRQYSFPEPKDFQKWESRDTINGWLLVSKRSKIATSNVFAWDSVDICAFENVVILDMIANCGIAIGDLVYEPPIDGPILWEIGILDPPFVVFVVPDQKPNYISYLYVIHPAMFTHYGFWEKHVKHIVEDIP